MNVTLDLCVWSSQPLLENIRNRPRFPEYWCQLVTTLELVTSRERKGMSAKLTFAGGKNYV